MTSESSVGPMICAYLDIHFSLFVDMIFSVTNSNQDVRLPCKDPCSWTVEYPQ